MLNQSQLTPPRKKGYEYTPSRLHVNTEYRRRDPALLQSRLTVLPTKQVRPLASSIQSSGRSGIFTEDTLAQSVVTKHQAAIQYDLTAKQSQIESQQ